MADVVADGISGIDPADGSTRRRLLDSLGHEPTSGRLVLVLRPAGASGLSSVWDVLLALLFAGIMLYPTLMLRVLAKLPLASGALTGSVLPATVLVLALIILTSILDLRARGRVPFLLVTGLYVATILALGKALSVQLGVSKVTTLEQSLVLLPLAAVAGYLVVRTGRVQQYVSWLLLLALPTTVAALYERFTGASVLGAKHYVQGGDTRAVVGTEHPLVLGALLVALIPIARWLLRALASYVVILALIAAVWATGSSGPLIVGIAVIAVCVMRPLARATLSTSAVLYTVLAGIAVYLWVGMEFLWSDQIRAVDENEVSNQYRGALYSVVPHILRDAPFGYGIGGVPPGRYRTYTVAAGAQDISRSIDSELVYSITQYGLIAIALYLAFSVVAVKAAVRNNAIGLCSLSTTLIGLFLAIHSWGSLGTFWLFFVGASLAVATARTADTDWRGLLPAETRTAPRLFGRDRPERTHT